MPIQLEVPVGVGREPVVVAAIENDGVVARDSALGEQLFELLLAHEVAPDRVLQVLLPVNLDRATDVALVVRGHVLVHFHDDDVGIVEFRLDPISVDQYVGTAHLKGSFLRM